MSRTHHSDIRRVAYMRRVNSPILVTILVLPLFLNACGTVKPISTASEQVSVPKLGTNVTVFVSPALIKFERLHDEAPLDASAYQGKAIEIRLGSVSRSMIRKRKITIVTPDIEASTLPTEIREKLPKWSRGIIDAQSTSLLQSLAFHDANMAILANYIDAKVGSRGTWDPNSGAITSDNSRSVFRSALLDCTTGQLLWKGEILLRELPKLTSKRFTESLDLLFLNFPHREDYQ